MLTKIRKVKLDPELKKPLYKVKLECPLGKELYIRFDYTYSIGKFRPLEVAYDGKRKGVKLAWYTNDVEKMSVHAFLEEVAAKINRKYKFELNN